MRILMCCCQVESGGVGSSSSSGVSHRDFGVTARPGVSAVATMTEGMKEGKEGEDEEEEASHRVHPGPNVKYDVVIHQDPPRREVSSPRHSSPARKESIQSQSGQNSVSRRDGSASQTSPPRPDHPTPPRKAGLAGVEKPPRRTRDIRSAPTPGTHASHHRDSPTGENSGGRDSLGRGGGARLRPSLSHSSGRGTPTGTPRSSPAPSINTRLCGSRGCQESGRTTPLGRSSSTNTGPLGRSAVLSRRESVKAAGNQGSAATKQTTTAAAAAKTTTGGGHNKVRSRGASLLGRWLNILE